MVNEKDALQFAHEWVAAWNSHDLDRIISHYAEELEFISPLIVQRFNDPDGTIRSRDALRKYFAIGLDKNPNLHFTFLQILTSVKGFTLLYENARGGQTAEYFERDLGGRVVRAVCSYSTQYTI